MLKELFDVFSEIIGDPSDVLVVVFFISVFIQILKYQNAAVEKYENQKDDYIMRAMDNFNAVFTNITANKLWENHEEFFTSLNGILSYCSENLFRKIIDMQNNETTLEQRQDIFSLLTREYKALKYDQYWVVDLEVESRSMLRLLKKYGLIRIAKVAITTFISFFFALQLILFITATYGKSEREMFIYTLGIAVGIVLFMISIFWIREAQKLWRNGTKKFSVLITILVFGQIGALKMAEYQNVDKQAVRIFLSVFAVIMLFVTSTYNKNKYNNRVIVPETNT